VRAVSRDSFQSRVFAINFILKKRNHFVVHVLRAFHRSGRWLKQ
jgi:hypothetical protein